MGANYILHSTHLLPPGIPVSDKDDGRKLAIAHSLLPLLQRLQAAQDTPHDVNGQDGPAVDFLLLFASQSQIQRAHPRSHASQHTPDDISRRDCSKLPAAVCAYQFEQAVKLRTLPGACPSHHRLLTACCLVMQQHSHADRLVMRSSKWNGGWHAGWKLPAVAGSLPALCPGRLASEACAVNEPDELPLLLPCAGQTPPA
jgi:hypothetical protein